MVKRNKLVFTLGHTVTGYEEMKLIQRKILADLKSEILQLSLEIAQ